MLEAIKTFPSLFLLFGMERLMLPRHRKEFKNNI